ncbi:hypothetical protein C922_01281 [Plasmodium inui San Antonio 1]|uniref:Uncharacterized protein n=1 Tax=Plasmodium inui San Antonio 1 TaxID=1237626 RepID=W7A579_9APIC|nr:hypothetical protein C922_01281 [Plasmodium inui San Antonio 1]EUD68262.1 hypothetical protein C922_01281 [Plasmodium inui San Antonio 1]
MERGHFYLKEQLENDQFNRTIQDEYRKRYGGVTKKEQYVEEKTSMKASVEASPDDPSRRAPLTEAKKPPLHQYISPFIELAKRFYSSLTLLYEPKLIHFSILLTTLWGFKSIKCINQLLVHKYADLHYQITRPDSLSSRYRAFKVLALGGSVVPGCFIGFTLYDLYWGRNNSVLVPHNEGASPGRSSVSPLIPYTLRRDISRKMRLLKEKTLFFAKDLAENNNFRRLSREYHRSLDRRLHGLSGKKGPMEWPPAVTG